jgi:Sigma-70 region 2
MSDTRAGPGAEAFTLVYRTERNRLRRVAYLMTGQAAVAEELVHDAFVRLHQRWDAVDVPAADSGPRDLTNVDAAQDIFDRYAGIALGLLDAQQAFADRIGDPDVQAGAAAYGSGLQLDQQTAQLARMAVLAAVSPGTESVRELSRLHTEVRQGLDALLAETAGTPYEEAAVTVVGQLEEAGLLESTGAVLGGSADVSTILASVDLTDGQGWPAFLDRVEDILAAES